MTEEWCSFDWCENSVYWDSLCIDHYAQIRVGKPLTPLSKRKTVAERLDSKTDKSGDCWLWTGSKNAAGRGQMLVDGKSKGVHRIAYEMEHGVIPEGFLVEQTCGNSACIHPEHLHTVTRKQNGENRKGATRVSRSGVRGAYWDKKCERWRSLVTHEGKQIYLGHFDTAEEAGEVARKKRVELFTHNETDRPETKED